MYSVISQSNASQIIAFRVISNEHISFELKTYDTQIEGTGFNTYEAAHAEAQRLASNEINGIVL